MFAFLPSLGLSASSLRLAASCPVSVSSRGALNCSARTLRTSRSTRTPFTTYPQPSLQSQTQPPAQAEEPEPEPEPEPELQPEPGSGWAYTRLHMYDLQLDATPSARISDDKGELEPVPGVRFTTAPHITVADLLALIRQETSDAIAKELPLLLLGWRHHLPTGTWSDCNVSPPWNIEYAQGPPDFIGNVLDYSPAVDRPVKKALQRLNKPIPPRYKQLVKHTLGPHGFSGWTIQQLTPNRTRRTTIANWILYWYAVHYPHYEWS